MRTLDGLFFAPGVRFKDLELDDANALADALGARSRAWFLEPARLVAPMSPFAAGVIITCFIDAAAEFLDVGFAEWILKAVPYTGRADPRRTTKTIADAFVEDVRNGLVHHARLNRGAEFSLDLERPIDVVNSVLVVNPLMLVDAIEAAWEDTLDQLRSDADLHGRTAGHVQRVFRVDFEADHAWAQDRHAG